jgi:hypothetical protein
MRHVGHLKQARLRLERWRVPRLVEGHLGVAQIMPQTARRFHLSGSQLDARLRY